MWQIRNFRKAKKQWACEDGMQGCEIQMRGLVWYDKSCRDRSGVYRDGMAASKPAAEMVIYVMSSDRFKIGMDGRRDMRI